MLELESNTKQVCDLCIYFGFQSLFFTLIDKVVRLWKLCFIKEISRHFRPARTGQNTLGWESLHNINIPKLDQQKNTSQSGEIAATLRFGWVILGDTGERKKVRTQQKPTGPHLVVISLP